MIWVQHSGMAARLQESRAETGVVAAPRTEAHRPAVREDCAGREAQKTAVWDSCVGREAQRAAVLAEGPRGRDWLAACRLALSEWDFSD